MGTSTSFAGGKNSNPLIPDWLDSGGTDDSQQSGTSMPPTDPENNSSETVNPVVSSNRYTTARKSFNAFSRSGGQDRTKLGRAVSSYISRASGGSRRAAQRMKAERTAIGNFAGILADASRNGINEVVRKLNLNHLINRPSIEIYAALVDVICPPGGDLDGSFSRDAYIEAIAQVAELGITDLDAPSKDTVLVIIEKFISNSIRDRILNAIAMNVVSLPDNIQTVQGILSQLLDFVSGAVSDAMTEIAPSVSVDSIQSNIGSILERSFQILQSLSEEESHE